MKLQNIAGKLILFGIMLVLASCSKDLNERNDQFPSLNPASSDINAGQWKTILLNAPDEISIAAPVPTNSPEFVAQLNEIKAWQSRMTADDRKNIIYWSAGAILRWNEILRELVAKYNLPPYQNADGTYPVPNAANPLAYPLFPFANPPYAARAYAYVSAAQYDALVSTYHYKKQFNRAAPYNIDSSITALIPENETPSFPSEDAAVIGATVEMLKMLFPGEQDFIQKKAEEHRRARITSGANIRNDLEAGETIGKAVAQKFVARARTDRAGQAGGNPTIWAKMAQDCIDRNETPWLSLEYPKRPPMLPLFGKTKTFLFDSLTAVSLRAGPPPSVNSEQMKKETKEIYELLKNPSRENIRIVHFWADGVGTYTPPGHWNAIASEEFIGKNFSEVRWARNLALLNMSLMDAAIVCWDTKFTYFNPRPSQLDANIKCVTGVPNFPSYISGHSTFSGAAAKILGHILPEKAAQFSAMAQEASLSRMYGGIHYRSDCEKGLEVGTNIGMYAVNRAKTDGAE